MACIIKQSEKPQNIKDFEDRVAVSQMKKWNTDRPFTFEVICDPVAGSTESKVALSFFAIFSICLLIGAMTSFSGGNPSAGWALLITGGGLSLVTISACMYMRRKCDQFNQQVYTFIEGLSEDIQSQYVNGLTGGTGDVSAGGLFITFTKEMSRGVLIFTDSRERNSARIYEYEKQGHKK